MELWIRSQDKETLLQVYNIHLNYEDNDNMFWLSNNDGRQYTTLGTYKTKERTLEVLDEIQDELIGSNFMPMEKDEEVVLTCGSIKIYEMPEE